MTIKCSKYDTENRSGSKYCQKGTSPILTAEEISPIETLKIPKEELTGRSTFAERYEVIEELGRDCIWAMIVKRCWM